MRSRDFNHPRMGGVPEAPKKTSKFYWNVNAEEFIPAAQKELTANNQAAAAAAEAHLNPLADEYILNHFETVYTPPSPVYIPHQPVYTPHSPVYTPHHPVYTPHHPVYTTFPSPFCYSQ
ncbi:hypothetical protein DFS34DRAFT_591035 [Phlyctochytrium arcticum]|nr:hypothetical protein DFS34DRAFT_591035 [Phlyctochytrium arcticum]